MFYVKVEPEGRFIYEAVNPAGMAMFAMTPEQFIGRTPEQAHGPERGAEIMDGLRTVLRTGDSHRFSRTWETPRGRRSYDVVYLPMRDEDGAIVSVLGMGRDDRRVGIHQITQIRKDTLPLDHQLLLHEPNGLRIIVPKKPG